MSDDLISRETLKKKLQARHDNGEEDFDKGYNIGIETAIDLIDNAPTVDGPKYILKVKNLTAEDKKRFQEEWNKSAGGLLAIPDNYEIISTERTQSKWGKWIISEIRCPNCLEYFLTDCYSMEELKKCPNCGAKMTTGDEEAET